MKVVGSGCGSVGRVVASDAKGPRFESSHRQTLISDIYLYTVNYIEKTKIKKKRPGMAHFLKKEKRKNTRDSRFCRFAI